MAYVVMAYIVLVHIGMGYVVMAYVVMPSTLRSEHRQSAPSVQIHPMATSRDLISENSGQNAYSIHPGGYLVI